jgi:hypothetical protein
MTILPAVGGYAFAHVVAGFGSKLFAKKPLLNMVANPAISFLALAGAWFATNYVLTDYQTEIVIGAAINFIQSLVTAFMPKLSWLLGGGKVSLPIAATLPDAMTDGGYSDNLSPDLLVNTDGSTQPNTDAGAQAEDQTLSDFNTGVFSGGFLGSN